MITRGTHQIIARYYEAIPDTMPLKLRVQELDDVVCRLSSILKEGEIGLSSWHEMVKESMCEVAAHLIAAGIVKYRRPDEK